MSRPQTVQELRLAQADGVDTMEALIDPLGDGCEDWEFWPNWPDDAFGAVYNVHGREMEYLSQGDRWECDAEGQRMVEEAMTYTAEQLAGALSYLIDRIDNCCSLCPFWTPGEYGRCTLPEGDRPCEVGWVEWLVRRSEQ